MPSTKALRSFLLNSWMKFLSGNQDRTDYEPGSLKVMQVALDRHLKEKGYSLPIIKDREFLSSRKVLEGKACKLQNKGKGKLPNKSQSLTREEEEVLWECGQLGNSSPRSLLYTMWWLLSQHLGFRGCQEHYTMNVEDFTLSKDNNDNEFKTFAEGPTKTLQGGLWLQPRSVLPNMFATGDSRCPVALFKSYLPSLMGKKSSSTRQPAEFLFSRLFSQVQWLAVAMYIASTIVMWW